MKNIDKLLEPFGFTFGQLQDVGTLLKSLKNNNIKNLTIDEFINYIEKKKTERSKTETNLEELLNKQQERWDQKTLKCPECKSPMNLLPVNTNRRNQTGDDSKSQWLCQKCWHDEYSTKTVAEMLGKLNL